VGEREAQAKSAAERFEDAVRTNDAGALCAALAPQTRTELEESEERSCARAAPRLELPAAGPVTGTDVYGRQAIVETERDTLFLSQFDSGWKIVAAGCMPEEGGPYRCTVKGG
jgi:hypothetical protein